MSTNRLLKFKLAGIIGYGYLISHAGIDQYSVAWPHREAERFSLTEAETRGFEVVEAEFEATLEETTVDDHANRIALSEKDERIKFLENELARYLNPPNTNAPDATAPNSTGPNTDETLTSFGLSANALKALHSAGIETRTQVIEYIKQNGSLEPIPGIAAKSEEAILKGLGIDKEALLQQSPKVEPTAS